MKNLILISLLLLPLKLFSQTDTPHIVTVQFDTTWNHSIIESDLILYVEIEKTVYVTGGGSFIGKVIQVIKGEFNDSAFGISLELMEFSRERSEKRFGAICPDFDKSRLPYRCYVGFTKENKHWNFIKDPVTKQVYHFFMSEKDLKEELKSYFFRRFWAKRLLPVYLRLTGN